MKKPLEVIAFTVDGDRKVIIVDDGRGADLRKRAALPDVTILRHAVPLGRMASLRTAINHALCTIEGLASVEIEGRIFPVRRLPMLVRFPALTLVPKFPGFPRLLAWFLLLLLAGLVGIEVHGFRTAGLFAQEIWTATGQARLIQFGGIYFAMAAAVLILVPWAFTRVAAGLLVLITLILLPKAVVAVGFFVFSAWCLGGGRPLPHGRGSSSTVAFFFGEVLLGVAVYLAVMTLVARLPIHYPLVYVAVLAIPIAIRRPPLRLPQFSILPTWGERAGFALLAFIFVIHWFAMLKPEAGSDGLAMHLAIPIDMAQHHMLTYEPSRFVWAVMPMGGDFLFAIVYSLGGEHAARLLNLVLLAVLLGLVHTAIRRWVGPATAYLLLALLAATPLVGLATGQLFVENLLAALLIASLLAIWRRAFVVAAVLAGAAMATKVGALPVVIGLILCAAVEKPRWRSAVLALALLIAVAAPPYAIAWAKTGNPIFPFSNQRFHSALLPRNFEIVDNRFLERLSWRTPYDLTFRTSRYYEGQNGSFGFQYLVFAPLALAALLAVRSRYVAGPVSIALGASYLIFRSTPNGRYLYPELPLLTIGFAALAGWASAHHRLLWRSLVCVAVAATMLDIWFLPSSSFWHKDLYGPFTEADRTAYMAWTAPLRVAIEWFNRSHAGAPVLLTQDSAIAGLTGEIYENSWHQPNTEDRLRHAMDSSEAHRVLDQWGVRYVIARKTDATELISPQALRDLVDRCAVPEFLVNNVYVARLQPDCTVPVRPQIVVGPGRYDDFEPVILYRGDWDHSTAFAEPVDHTISYAEIAGSEASMIFEGREVTWIFTKAANRGIAAVTIDGVQKGNYDLYFPQPLWREQIIFDHLGSGKHLLVIRVTGEKQPASSDTFVDVDALLVK